MYNLPKPAEPATDVYATCISRVRDIDLRNRLNECSELISAAAVDYDKKMLTFEIHDIVREVVINGNVTAEQLANVYTSRMVPPSSPGRAIYDKIFISASNGICPLCSHRQVKTVDHYLPKMQYSKLAVTPINLVPACRDCNTDKLTGYPNVANEITFHPYYDDISAENWLKAKVSKTSPPSIIFFVDPPKSWDDLLIARMKYHFDSFDLNTLYSVQAAVELSNLNFILNKYFDVGGLQKVKNYLYDEARSRIHANKNSWQTAIYTAMADDDWFCGGGFNF